MRAPSGGTVHSPGGGGSVRSAPSSTPRGQYQAPRAYRAERAPRAYRAERSARTERSSRSERTRRAESRRSDRAQRVRREQSKDVRRAGREGLSTNAPSTNRRASQERRGREEASRTEQRVTERHKEIQNARTRLSPENRDRLRRAFDFDRARVRNVNFDHHVGRHIPRRIHLFPIAVAVFDFFPYYRDYSYFVDDEDIYIVDPRTYVVVDVIDRGYWGGSGRAPQVSGLHLSAREIALVRDSIPPDFPDAGLRLRLALGAEIPDNVELYGFSTLVLERIPRLRQYRFLVSGDQVVIVDPRDRSIALVIDRR